MNPQIAYRDLTPLEIERLGDLLLPSIHLKRSSEIEWLSDYYSVALAIRDHLELTARVRPIRNLPPRHEAILMGHMVRLFKWYDTFLLLVAGGRSEIAYGLWRSIVETGIHLLYLIRRGTPEIFEDYIRAARAYDKKALSAAGKHRHETVKGIPLLTDEEFGVIRDEVARAFRRSGHVPAELDERDIEWGIKGSKKISEKASHTGQGLEYDLFFRFGSRMLHGTWYDLENFQLWHPAETDRHEPKTTYTAPDVNILMPTSFCIKIAHFYLAHILEKPGHPLMLRLHSFSNWLLKADEEYGRFGKRQKRARIQ